MNTGAGIKALLFDVFGTVVDWRSSVIREAAAFGKAAGVAADWAALADAWRGKYRPFMDKVRRGELPWTNLDALHRLALEEVLEEFGIAGAGEAAKADLSLAWHRLEAWPDAPAGLARLKARYVIAALSNGNVALMTNLARYAGLPWDCILGAELARAYKPEPRVYLTAVELLGLRPEQVMMVAAHPGDLLAAAALDLKTALVPRPLEHGPAAPPARIPSAAFDLVAGDFRDLAAQLGG